METTKNSKIGSILTALLLMLAATPALADNTIHVGQCFQHGEYYRYQIVSRLSKHTYGIASDGVLPQYQVAVLEAQRDFDGPTMIGGPMVLVGETELVLRNGFTKKVPLFKPCK